MLMMPSITASYAARQHYRTYVQSFMSRTSETCCPLTQTIQTAMQPFMSRFLCVKARTVGRPVREDGVGNLSVLYVW